MVMANATDEILPVKQFAREDGDWIARCPHCKRVVSMDGEETVRGEMFQDRVCGGWMEIEHDAIRLKRLPDFDRDTDKETESDHG